MQDLTNVDLICVDGRSEDDKVAASSRALIHSTQGMTFNSVRLLSPIDPLRDPRILHVKIKPLDLVGYNKFMLCELGSYVGADFVLLVQWDGFIVNPHLWDKEFLKYDYIGAPWPRQWPNRIARVGNGGFSLRSKKLLNQNVPATFDYKEPEDNILCLHNRIYLQKNGIKFAPVEVAARFALENDVEENQPKNSFGFHGRHLPWHKEYLSMLHEKTTSI